ncbi:MAG: phosphoribosylaminoimidazolesuccinocarboxamide synthase [Candidatus Brocadiae bacterium]|nr:phosphoribosylaminoimidazolesuccinocarboxamide synthase [Candidatus Brocadiia bacterium]
MKALTASNLDLRVFRKGKVRDVYDLDDRLLFIATDRISAFDVVMPTGIPDKGRILTQLATFWFQRLDRIAPHHLLETDVDRIPQIPPDRREEFRGRAVTVRKVSVFPVECVVRGYLAGSGWKEYQESGAVCGVPLPKGLREADRLPAPIFTPATKEDVGHDVNIDFDRMASIVGRPVAETLRDLSIRIYAEANAYAMTKGIILADTKFEWGWHDGKPMLVDEVLTPDSSRYWPQSSWVPGRNPPSYDKQYLRDWLSASGWKKEPPAPALPDDIVLKVREKYLEAYRVLTGKSLTES